MTWRNGSRNLLLTSNNLRNTVRTKFIVIVIYSSIRDEAECEENEEREHGREEES